MRSNGILLWLTWFDIINFAQRTTNQFQNDDYFSIVLSMTIVVYFSLDNMALPLRFTITILHMANKFDVGILYVIPSQHKFPTIFCSMLATYYVCILIDR